MGNAGNITAYWLGFKEYSKIKRNLKPMVIQMMELIQEKKKSLLF